MARSRSRRKSAASETSKTLVAFLVFFILSTIGAGVGAYYGFAEQEQLVADKKKALDEKKVSDEEAAFYRFLYNYSRPYFGLEPDFDFDLLEDDGAADPEKIRELNEARFKRGFEDYLGTSARVGDTYKQDQSDALISKAKDFAKKLNSFAPVDKTALFRPYNPNGAPPDVPPAGPKPTYTVFDMRDAFAARVGQIQQQLETVAGKFDAAGKLLVEGEIQQVQKALATEQAKIKTIEVAQKAAEDKFKADLKTFFGDKENKEEGKYTKLAKDLAERFRKDYESKFAEAKRLAKINADLQKENENIVRQLTQVRKELQETQRDLYALKLRQQKRLEAVQEKPLTAAGKIIRVDRSQQKAYINLSERSGLKKGVTFSVYDDDNGRPSGSPKGTVEVIDVQPTLAIVAIRNVFQQEESTADYTDRYGTRASVDPLSLENTNPIKIGDLLVNPTWDPNRKTYVAIAGTVDLNGDGYNQIETLVRALERQNVIVDVYQEPRKGDLKGRGVSNDPQQLKKHRGFTTKTSILILGRSPTAGVVGEARLDPRTKGILDGMSALQTAAKEKGVRIVQLERFLDEIGLPRPRVDSAVDRIRKLSP